MEFGMNPLLDRISIDPNVCFGKPCIKGTRIWVSLILDFLANGDTAEDIQQAYPQLQPDDIRAVLAYAAEMARERELRVGRNSGAYCAGGWVGLLMDVRGMF
jgi:uncharacterized protein (DUF433 family)